jgi:hypothetical protein
MANDIQHYRAQLRTNRLRLDEDLEVQAEMQEQISSRVSRMNTKVLEAKEQLALVEARLTQDLGEEQKLTVAELAAKVRRHRDRIEAFRAWMDAREEHEEWQGLLDAWKSKGFAMKDLGGLYASQYFAVNSVGGPSRAETRRNERDSYRTDNSQAARWPRTRVQAD